MPASTWSRFFVFAFFLGLLVLGWHIAPDYGISWDEDFQREYGKTVVQYVNDWLGLSDHQFTERKLMENNNRYHSPLFPAFTFALERLLRLEAYPDYQLMRHRVLFLLFWLALIAMFGIGLRRFGDWRWALLGSIFLVLSPRIFANAFFNIKDMVMLPMFVFATWSLLLLYDRPRWPYALLHAFTCSLAIATRMTGVILPALTIGIFALSWMNACFDRRMISRYLPVILVFSAGLCCFTTALWPTLWKQPFLEFTRAFGAMSQFNWDGPMLYRGGFVRSTQLPWHYAPWWILISTPLVYTLLFGIGTGMILWRLLAGLRRRQFFRSREECFDLIFLALFLGPLLAVILARSVLYDTWRHLFFVYPAFLLTALSGLFQFTGWIRKKWPAPAGPAIQKAWLAIAGINLLGIGAIMVREHPFQHVYFNALIRGDQVGHYPLDYWGVGYKQAFEQIAARHPGDTVRVAVENYPGWSNHKYLADTIRHRLRVYEPRDMDQVEYYLTNWRYWNDDWPAVYHQQEPPFDGEEKKWVEVDGSAIIGIFYKKEQEKRSTSH